LGASGNDFAKYIKTRDMHDWTAPLHYATAAAAEVNA